MKRAGGFLKYLVILPKNGESTIAGNDEWEDIYDFAVDERETLRNYLGLKNGIPSHDTMQRVFAIIRPDELQGMLKEILVQMVEMAGQHLDRYLYQNEELDCYVHDVIAADRKETRHTAKKHAKNPEDLCNLNEFNVMSTEWGICLSSTRINEKTNEIPEMQAVMKGLDCRKCIVTADAMNAQKETARVIVVFREDSLGSKEKKAVHNLGLIRRFVMFIIKLMKTYYGRSMRRVRKTIGRKPETELPLILAVLRVLYTNDLLDSIDELTK